VAARRAHSRRDEVRESSTIRKKTQDGETEKENKNLFQSVASSVTTDTSSLQKCSRLSEA